MPIDPNSLPEMIGNKTEFVSKLTELVNGLRQLAIETGVDISNLKDNKLDAKSTNDPLTVEISNEVYVNYSDTLGINKGIYQAWDILPYSPFWAASHPSRTTTPELVTIRSINPSLYPYMKLADNLSLYVTDSDADVFRDLIDIINNSFEYDGAQQTVWSNQVVVIASVGQVVLCSARLQYSVSMPSFLLMIDRSSSTVISYFAYKDHLDNHVVAYSTFHPRESVDGALEHLWDVLLIGSSSYRTCILECNLQDGTIATLMDYTDNRTGFSSRYNANFSVEDDWFIQGAPNPIGKEIRSISNPAVVLLSENTDLSQVSANDQQIFSIGRELYVTGYANAEFTNYAYRVNLDTKQSTPLNLPESWWNNNQWLGWDLLAYSKSQNRILAATWLNDYDDYELKILDLDGNDLTNSGPGYNTNSIVGDLANNDVNNISVYRLMFLGESDRYILIINNRSGNINQLKYYIYDLANIDQPIDSYIQQKTYKFVPGNSTDLDRILTAREGGSGGGLGGSFDYINNTTFQNWLNSQISQSVSQATFGSFIHPDSPLQPIQMWIGTTELYNALTTNFKNNPDYVFLVVNNPTA